MLIIRNNSLCPASVHRMLDKNLRLQAETGMIVLPEYCEVLAFSEGNPEVIVVDHEGNRIQVQQRGMWLNSSRVAFAENCSVCGFAVPWDNFGKVHRYRYCPNCGAKMDLK